MLDHDLDGRPHVPASVLGAPLLGLVDPTGREPVPLSAQKAASRTVALASAGDIYHLPPFALLPERGVRTLLGGCSSMTIERLVIDGALPRPMRLRGESGRGSSPRLWTVADVRALVDRMAAAQRGAA